MSTSHNAPDNIPPGHIDPSQGEAVPPTEALHTAIVNSAIFCSIATDAKGVIQIFNRGAERMLGYPASEVVNRLTLVELHDPQEAVARAAALSIEFDTPIAPGFDALMFKASRGIEDIYELTKIRKDGSRFRATVSVTALHDGQSAVIGYLLIGTDSTAHRQVEAEKEALEAALFAEKERAQVTLDSIGDAVISTDACGGVTYLNAAAERLTGWSGTEAVGRPLLQVFNVVDATTRVSIDDPGASAMRRGQAVARSTNWLLLGRDGSELPIEDSAAPIHQRDGQVTGAVIVFRDVSASRALDLKMAHFAHYDVLTNLPNRTLFDDRIMQTIVLARRQRTQAAVLFVDLDQFKQINDSMGHGMGDALLQSVAGRLLACVRASDTVSRRGGDEFIVLLSHLQRADYAVICAERIIAAIAAPHPIANHVLHVTASVGISVYPDDSDNPNGLVAAAAVTANFLPPR